MRTFIDNQGRTWTLLVNVDAVKRVRDLIHVDLLEVMEGKLLERLSGDPVLLCDVIWCLIKPEADTKGVSDVDFGRAMAGDAIDRATEALLEGLADFFPSRKGRLLRRAISKLRTLQEKALNVVEARLDSGELDHRLEAFLKQPGDSSGAAPASSASTPAP